MAYYFYRYLGDRTGFVQNIITPTFCVGMQIRKTWILTTNPRFPVNKSESAMIAARFRYPINLKN
jgi:hypothetical protein